MIRHQDISSLRCGIHTRGYHRVRPLSQGDKGRFGFDDVVWMKNGDLEKVDAVDKKTRMANFVDWLNGFDKAIVLAGYNNHNYDDFVLAHNLLEAGVDVEELKMMSDYARFVLRLNSTVASRLFLILFSFLCNSFDYFCFVCRGQRQQQGWQQWQGYLSSVTR